jgi:ankyrin repeat protein
LVNELGANVNQRNEHGLSALLDASDLGYYDTVRYLVKELGADVNIENDAGQTPLFFAASKGDLDMVRILLRLGADIDQRANFGVTLGVTPLMIASIRKHEEVVKWLVKAGADTQIADHTYTAADYSRGARASAEQTSYLEAKTKCSNPQCSGAGIMKCTGCRQARYCREACQLAHWKAHKADCKRWSSDPQGR